MSRERSAQLRLIAITLRGIGSYLHGTRLEIQPLTILCGPNGSGKSTWIKILDTLKQAAANGKLPLYWEEKTFSDNYNHTNSYLAQHYHDAPATLSGGDEEEFGPPGTVGLMFEAPDGLQMSKRPMGGHIQLPPSELLQFLETGECEPKTRFAVFLSNAQRELGGEPNYVRGFELRMNEERIKVCLPPDGGYEIYVRMGKGLDLHDTNIPSLTRTFRNGRMAAPETAGPEWLARREAAEGRVNELVDLLLSGFFHIGAVRQIEKTTRAENADAAITESPSRYVGLNGEHSHFLRGRYLITPMIQPRPPYSGAVDHRYQGVRPAMWIHETFLSAVKPKARYLWNRLPESMRDRWTAFCKANKAEFGRWHYGPTNPNPPEFVAAAVDVNCGLMNHLLTLKDLYKPDLWPSPGAEARFYLELGVDKLAPQDLARLNRMFIDQLLEWPAPYEDWNGRFNQELGLAYAGYAFDVFIGYWMNHICGVRTSLIYEDCDIARAWRSEAEKPAGYLFAYSPVSISSKDDSYDAKYYSRYFGPTFEGIGLPVAPGILSSGFHQVIPIIVQVGLMKQYEVCAIENPEVHLHPESQSRIAEFLVRQAATGKFMLVETHSDLVVMRTLRAILEETISEGYVNIAFSHLEAQNGLCFSELDSIHLDAMGRIDNWPPGFMDVAQEEMHRIMDAISARQTKLEDEAE